MPYANCAPYAQIPTYKLFCKKVMCKDGFRRHQLAKPHPNKDTSLRFHHKSYAKQFKRPTATNLSGSLDSRAKLGSLQSYFLAFRYDEEEEVEGNIVGDEVEDADDTGFALDAVQAKTKEYNARLRQDPSNIDLWLEFLAFQDEALQDFAGSEGGKKKSATVRDNAVVEKKLAVVKTAMEKNPKSVVLAMERLRLSKQISDVASLERQWKEVLLMFPENLAVLKNYLDFSTSHFTSFKLGKVTRAFRTCFAKLKGMHGDGSRGSIDVPSLEDEMVNMLVRLAHLWAGAGYTERAVGLFQALLELNFRSPDFPGFYSLEDRLALFEPFWESAAPRMGEFGAIGWKAVMKVKTGGSGGDDVVNEAFASMFDDEEFDNPNNDEIEVYSILLSRGYH